MLRRTTVTWSRASRFRLASPAHYVHTRTSELATGLYDEQPTVEAVDTILARTRQYDAKKQWAHSFSRLNDSFTRQQLFQLARDAKLDMIKHSMTKPMLIKAFLVQRFGLTDPEAGESFAFIRLPLSSVFLLSHRGTAFFQYARNIGAKVAIGKRDEHIGVNVSGSKQAVENMNSWLNSFQQVREKPTDMQSIRKSYRQFNLPEAMIPWISHRTQCHVSQEGRNVNLSFLHHHDADQALMLMEQQKYHKPIHWNQLWCFTPDQGASVSSLPFTPSSVPDPLTEYALTQGRWSRLSGMGPASLSILCHLSDPSTLDPVATFASGLDHGASSLNQAWLDGPWEPRLSLAFGHVLWKDLPRMTQPLTTPMHVPAYFVESELPNTAEQTPIIPGWTELLMDELEFERIYYRRTTSSDPYPVDLVVSVAIYPNRVVPERSWWQCEAHAPILCPYAPLDACLTVKYKAPANLQGTSLSSILSPMNYSDKFSNIEEFCTALPTETTLNTNPNDRWRIWRRERVVQRSSTYFHADHTSDLVLVREAVRRNSMSHFQHITRLESSNWSSDYIGVLSSLLRTSYPSLGRSDT